MPHPASSPVRRDPGGAERLRRAAALLAVPAVLALAGCSASADEDPPTAGATSAIPSTPGAPAATTTGGPSCPDAATLFGLLPATGDGELATPQATCSGSWAVIGVSYAASPSVAVFRIADGAWQPVDTADACSSGDLPADLEPGVCDAG